MPRRKSWTCGCCRFRTPLSFLANEAKRKTTMLRRTISTLALTLVLTLPAFAADAKPIKVLIITGDHGHAWKETTPFLKEVLTKAGMTVDVAETPAKDLTADKLAKYDVLLLNYKDTKNGGPDTRWSDD